MIPINLTWEQAYALLWPLVQFTIGIVIYSVFVFKFYRFLAHRDVITLNLNQYNTASHAALEKFLAVVFWLLEFIIIFPLLILFWFGVITTLISFLSTNQAIETTMMVAFALVSSVRVTSYFSENLSQDLAKMLPFAMLGVFLLDIGSFQVQRALEVWTTLQASLAMFPYYLLYIACLEVILRVSRGVHLWFSPRARAAAESEQV